MKILLIEDDSRTAAFIVKGLKKAGYAVARASNGEKGLQMAQADLYDLAIVDIMLPKMDGLSLIKELRQKNITTPVMVLSAKTSVNDRVKGLQKGGDDYMVKPFSFAELLARIEAITRRTISNPETTTLKIADLSLDLLRRKVFRGAKEIVLSVGEFELLEYLMRRAGQVVSRNKLIEDVWEYNFDPETNIIESRICRLRDKIDRGFNKSLLHTVTGFGYVIQEKK